MLLGPALVVEAETPCGPQSPNNYDLDLYRESLLTSALRHKVSYTVSQLQIKWWCKQAIVT